jgi:peptidoglycan/LPS O-acetylase OafA/YrhL
MTSAPTRINIEPPKRFHDLDALRSFAMLLGIVLHAIVWEDVVNSTPSNGNRPNVYTLIYDVIHGFRMPVFVLLSGFFTAMLWRRRGLAHLLRNRTRRVLLPLLVFTPIVGLLSVVGWSVNPSFDISLAVASNDPARLEVLFKTKDINTTALAGLTPLQLAARQGKTESAKWLIASGADLAVPRADQPVARDADTALDLARKGGFVGIERLLVAAGAPALTTVDGYRAKPLMIIDFGHLWFLWLLWLLVLGFLAVSPILERISAIRVQRWLMLTPVRYLWLIPLTLVFQSFMTTAWGPDTFSSVFMPLHQLGYYAVFFVFGALYYDCGRGAGHDIQRWWLELPVALFAVFPLGAALSYSGQAPRLVVDALSVLYAWLMTFGLIGLCRRIFSQDNQTVRYVSDSSYFLYIMHLPLLLFLTNLLVRYPFPKWVKIIIMCVVTTGVLLLIYEHLVRYRWLGRWLNGPRQRGVQTKEVSPLERRTIKLPS